MALGLASEDHDTTRGIMARLWLAHNNLYCMYGMWYFGELTKFVLTVYCLWFQVLPVQNGRDVTALHPPIFPECDDFGIVLL